MKPFNALILVSQLISTGALAETVTFDDGKGEAPAGWPATKMGSGQPKWTVVADNSPPRKPNVLRQSGEATDPVCLKDDPSQKDGFLEVWFRPVAGTSDQTGGMIWRAQDPDNSFIARDSVS